MNPTPSNATAPVVKHSDGPPKPIATLTERPQTVVTQKPAFHPPPTDTYASNTHPAPPPAQEQPIPPATTTVPVAQPEEPVTHASVTEKSTANLDAGPAQPGQSTTQRAKNSFFEKLNPRNWIGSKKTTPEADKVTVTSDSSSGPRYVYPLPVTPVPGNRADAERYVQEGERAQRDGRLDDAQGYVFQGRWTSIRLTSRRRFRWGLDF